MHFRNQSRLIQSLAISPASCEFRESMTRLGFQPAAVLDTPSLLASDWEKSGLLTDLSRQIALIAACRAASCPSKSVVMSRTVWTHAAQIRANSNVQLWSHRCCIYRCYIYRRCVPSARAWLPATEQYRADLPGQISTLFSRQQRVYTPVGTPPHFMRALLFFSARLQTDRHVNNSGFNFFYRFSFRPA